jgi:hypothetical protein
VVDRRRSRRAWARGQTLGRPRRHRRRCSPVARASRISCTKSAGCAERHASRRRRGHRAGRWTPTGSTDSIEHLIAWDSRRASASSAATGWRASTSSAGATAEAALYLAGLFEFRRTVLSPART